MIKYIILLICYFLAEPVLADGLTGPQNAEMLAMVRTLNHCSMAFRGIMMQQMLVEANFAAERLKLPTRYPICATDICGSHISWPWDCVMHPGANRFPGTLFPDTIYGEHIFDSNISRESRLQALKVGPYGYINNATYQFGFDYGRLCHIMRLSLMEPYVEYYAHDLDKLVGKPSLIYTNDAYQMATQWLSAIDVDMSRVNKLKWVVNQLHYLPKGATNTVTLPLFYVDFGSKHYPASGNLVAFDKPLITVEILGTTKELQELLINDESFCGRPVLLVTNMYELINTTNRPIRPSKDKSGP
jgi:hypothetical protein